MCWQIFILIGYCGTRHNTPKLPPTYVYANYLQHGRIHLVAVVSLFVAFELCVKPAKHCFVEIHIAYNVAVMDNQGNNATY